MKSLKVISLIVLTFSCTLNAQGRGNRHKYGGRVLNIAPSDCTSPKYPNVTGTCMISLECQQRSGTVIGACRDGLLFGACCLDANEVPTTTPTEIISTSTKAPTTSQPHPTTSTTFATTSLTQNLPVQNAISSVLKIQASTSQKHDLQKVKAGVNDNIDQPLYYKNDVQELSSSTPGNVPNSIIIQTSTESNLHTISEATEKPVPIITSSSASPTADQNNPVSESTAKLEVNVSTTTTKTTGNPDSTLTTDQNTFNGTVAAAVDNLRASAEATTAQLNNGSNVSTLPVAETTTVRASSPTTKFFYGKIKYSPKPMKFRSTTTKTVWTRPPTTETSYSVFTTSEEEDDEVKRKPSRRVPSSTEKVSTTKPTSTETVTTSISGQSEESTPAFQRSTEVITNAPSMKSTEELVDHNSTEEVTTSVTQSKSREEIIQVYQKSTEEITKPYPKYAEMISESSSLVTETTVTPIESPTTVAEVANTTIPEIRSNISIPQKNVRIVNPSTMSHRIGASNQEDSSSGDDSSSSNSAGWDNKLDEFVNQVVEGIAEELDKSNIDDVVFKPSTTTTTTTTTTTAKPKTKSEKIALKRKKSKGKGSTTRHRTSPKPKKKPTKKVTVSKDEDFSTIALDYRKDCGVKPLESRQSRIVGGAPSQHGSWPWHALVKETVWWGIFSKIKCGGVLIGPRHVLTAAHCQPQQTGKLSVVLGVTDSDNPNTNAVTKGVRRVILHPQFNPRSYENDIAFLELDSPVEFQPHIVPICLPDSEEVFEGREGFVTGMGLLRHDGERPLVLHEVDVPILNNSDCQMMFKRSGNFKPIKKSFICAGYPQGLKDSCGGDSGSYPHQVALRQHDSDEQNFNETLTEFFSGGPLSVKRTNGQWVLAGTVSHGIKCAVPNQPGVYMRTQWYLPFINKLIQTSRSQESAKCHGPPGFCDHHHSQRTQPKGILDTLFRVFRLARKFWRSRK